MNMSVQTMELIAKFNNVVIQNTSRISEADRLFCESKEKEFIEAIDFMFAYKTFLETGGVNNSFYNSDGLLPAIEDKHEDLIESFIHKVVHYFEETYRVSIDQYKIRSRYDEDTRRKVPKYDHTIRYSHIVDEIIEQLGGYSFEERAVQEIKGNFQNHLGRNHKPELKKNKITITNYLYWQETYTKGYSRLSYGRSSELWDLFKALSLFETGDKSITGEFVSLYQTYDREGHNDTLFTKFELENEKIIGVRCFKNGKVEITFSSHEYADSFARDYCGDVRGVA